jgi:PAS domain S-box-containing protein
MADKAQQQQDGDTQSTAARGDSTGPAGDLPATAGLLDELPCPYQSLDEEGNVLHVNRAWLRMLGYTPDRVLGRSFADFLVDGQHLLFHERFQAFREKGEVRGARFDLVRQDGSRLPVLIDGHVECDPKRGFLRTHCVLREADEQVRLAASLLRSQTRLHCFTGNLLEGVLTLDQQGRITYANPRTEAILGYAPAELVGRPVLDLMDDRWRGVLRQGLAALRSGYESEPATEVALRHRDGHELQVQLALGDLFDEQHRQTGTVLCVLDTSDWHRTEKRLREDRDLYQSLLDTSRDAIFMFASEQETVFANRQACRMYGTTQDELLQTAPLQLIPEEHHRGFRAFLETVDAGREFSTRITARRLDGTTFPAAVYGSTIEVQGRPLYYLSMHDVSELERTTSALQESETLYQQLFRAMASGVAIYEADDDTGDFIIRDLNPVGCRHAGLTREEVVGRRLRDVFPGVAQMGLLDALREVWRTGEPRKLPVQQYADGRILLWVENYLFPLPSREVVAVYNDVTEQKQREEQAHENARRLQELLQNMPVILDAFDENGVPLVWNKECERVTGYSADEVIGNPRALSRLYPDPDVLRHRMEWQSAAGGGFRDMEWTIRRKDGTYRTLLMSNISQEFPVPGWATWATGLDVTVFKQGQREASIRHEELEERVRERTEELRATIQMMAGRENRMAELKEVVQLLRQQLIQAGLMPAVDDPLRTGEEP